MSETCHWEVSLIGARKVLCLRSKICIAKYWRNKVEPQAKNKNYEKCSFAKMRQFRSQ